MVVNIALDTYNSTRLLVVSHAFSVMTPTLLCESERTLRTFCWKSQPLLTSVMLLLLSSRLVVNKDDKKMSA